MTLLSVRITHLNSTLKSSLHAIQSCRFPSNKQTLSFILSFIHKTTCTLVTKKKFNRSLNSRRKSYNPPLNSP